jgi:hypothetical protein
MPLSTTSQRTFRGRQQWHALEARLFTVLTPVDKPAAVDVLLSLGWVVPDMTEKR